MKANDTRKNCYTCANVFRDRLSRYPLEFDKCTVHPLLGKSNNYCSTLMSFNKDIRENCPEYKPKAGILVQIDKKPIPPESGIEELPAPKVSWLKKLFGCN